MDGAGVDTSDILEKVIYSFNCLFSQLHCTANVWKKNIFKTQIFKHNLVVRGKSILVTIVFAMSLVIKQQRLRLA